MTIHKMTINKTPINVSGVDAINNQILTSDFKRVAELYPEYQLSIKTFHTNEIYDRVRDGLDDIGLTFSKLYRKNTTSTLLRREPMYLITATRQQTVSQLKELRRQNEIYLPWSHEFEEWHSKVWDNSVAPRLTVNTGSMLGAFIEIENAWTIAPSSVITLIKKMNVGVQTVEVNEKIPELNIFQITRQNNSERYQSFLTVFEKRLFDK